MQIEDYGPLAFIVTFAGFLIAVVTALRALWAGKFLWDPELGQMERAAVKVAGLGTAVGLALAFASFYGDLRNPLLIKWMIGVGIMAVLLFLLDLGLRQMLFIQCEPNGKRIVRGFRLNPRARDLLQGKPIAIARGDLAEFDQPPPSARVLYCSLPPHLRDPDRVWSHSSQVAAVVAIIAVYVLWSGLATNGLALAAMLISGAVAN
jgi:hypothetical protein